MGTKASDARKTKEQLEKEAELKERFAKLAEGQKRDFSITFGTPEGRRTLRAIMARCKYQSPITWADEGKVYTENLVHNSALQGLYLWIRQQIDRETLIAVEIDDLKDNVE